MDRRRCARRKLSDPAPGGAEKYFLEVHHMSNINTINEIINKYTAGKAAL